MNTSRWGAALVIVALGAVLVGCAGGSSDADGGETGGSGASASSPSSTTESSPTPEVALGPVVTREVEVLSAGGQTIFGTLYRPEGVTQALPVVIMSNGLGSTEEVSEPYARYLAGHGIAAVTFDFIGGSPRSRSGTNMTQMSVLTEKLNLVDVVDYVRAMPDVDKDRLFLMGESQGGMVSALLAAEIPDKVRAIVLLYPAFIIPSMGHASYDSIEEIPQTFEFIGLTLGKQYYVDVWDMNVDEAIKPYTGDVLLIHGDEDPLVPVSVSEHAVKVYDHAELRVIEGGSHGFKANPEALAQANAWLLEFIEARL